MIYKILLMVTRPAFVRICNPNGWNKTTLQYLRIRIFVPVRTDNSPGTDHPWARDLQPNVTIVLSAAATKQKTPLSITRFSSTTISISIVLTTKTTGKKQCTKAIGSIN